MFAPLESEDPLLGNSMQPNGSRVIAPVALERWESDGGALPPPQPWLEVVPVFVEFEVAVPHLMPARW